MGWNVEPNRVRASRRQIEEHGGIAADMNHRQREEQHDQGVRDATANLPVVPLCTTGCMNFLAVGGDAVEQLLLRRDLGTRARARPESPCRARRLFDLSFVSGALAPGSSCQCPGSASGANVSPSGARGFGGFEPCRLRT